ncbi:MAG TPA: nitroreductase [Hyphomicrobiaceae bacterium]|nr:nitroreductase [Hyphomicrobiaceae bacterium]
MMTVEEAIAGRRSNRAFLPKPVPRELIARVLQLAGHAPSGSNIQPWKVWVLDGAVKQAVARELCDRYDAGKVDQREYNYYPVKWREPYLARRRACGWGLYGLLGIARGDKDKMHAQHRRNFLFFDAPVGLVFSIDRDLEKGSWLDYGMFLQTIMLAARPFGLETCPQAAFLDFADVLQRRLGIPAAETIVCGMALGYPDPDDNVNAFSPERIDVEEFVTFVEDVVPDQEGLIP